MRDEIRPPWTAEQVAGLNRFQRAGFMHPFTCPDRHGLDYDDRILTATPDGWVCLKCGYTQKWAHAFMVEEPIDPLASMRAANP